ncbi:xanthine dehydrogenase family protein molybdopterin-binding subunit [Paradesulfitobacterium aromaticivorans]
MSEKSEFSYIGKSVTPIDAWEKATGRAQFVTDLSLPGMLYGKILRSPYAHARIVRIDTSKAKEMPGVKAVVTFEDTPKVKFGPMASNEDWYIFAKDKVRFIGEEVAAVAAVDEDTAEKALELIEVVYEELPAVFDLEEAMKPGAPVIHEDWPRNIAAEAHIEHGDVEQGFTDSDLIIEETFSTSQVYHAYMETMAVIVRPEDRNRLTMWLPIQIPNKVRLIYAKALGISSEDIRVIKPFIGGAFGAKMETNLHLACAVLAQKTKRPVKIVNTRHEDFIAGNPRVPMQYWVKMGFRKDGKITAKHMRVVAGNGGRTVYGPAIMSTACYRIDALYVFENVKAEGYAVYTNSVPTSSFRGFGNSQSIFVLESMMDMAAEKLNIPPGELRKINAVQANYTNIHGWKIGTAGLIESVDKAVEAMEQRKKEVVKPGKVRGIGLACCNHVSGNRGFFPTFDGSAAVVRIGEDGKVVLYHGECDMGQGQNTVFAQIVAEELGAKFADVQVGTVDTQISPFGLGSWATRGTTIGGMGAKAGAEAAKKILFEAAAVLLGVKPEELSSRESVLYVTDTPDKKLNFAEVARSYVFKHGGASIIGNGYYVPDTVAPDPKTKYGNISPAYVFGTHIAEVEIDTETGRVEVVNYWAAHDVGRALNPTLLEGQVEGGVSMGLGWTLMENMITKNGEVLNAGFLDYRVPGPKDVPRVHTMWVEPVEPNGPFGAKGIGEPALNPVPAAIANAIYNAIGVRFTQLPITPEQVLAMLKEKEN